MYEELTIKERLGQGAFGEVYLAQWRKMACAVKIIKRTDVTNEVKQEFLAEATLMMNMKPHQNVVQFLAVCPEPLCIVTEYCAKGSLWGILQSLDLSTDPHLLLQFVKDIAKGMLHLQLENIIHKDLATRNVLITKHQVAKVSDFGLSRLVGGKVYVSKSAFGPLKWMAPESFQSRIYSSKSDVWSFGITCIEIYTRAIPYPHLTTAEFIEKANSEWTKVIDYIPSDPSIPEELRAIIKKCLQMEPNQRPDFEEISTALENVSDGGEETEQQEQFYTYTYSPQSVRVQTDNYNL